MTTPAVRRLIAFAALLTYWTAFVLGGGLDVVDELVPSVSGLSSGSVAGVALSFAAGLVIGRWWAVLASIVATVLIQLVEPYLVGWLLVLWAAPVAIGVVLHRAAGVGRGALRRASA